MAGDRCILLRFASDAVREALIGLSRQLFNEISGLAACREREAEDTTHGLEKDDWIGSIRERHSLIHSGQKNPAICHYHRALLLHAFSALWLKKLWFKMASKQLRCKRKKPRPPANVW